MGGNGAWEPAVDRIIFKEMNIPRQVGPGVDGHQFQVLIGGGQEPGETPADTPEAINGYLDRQAPSRSRADNRPDRLLITA